MPNPADGGIIRYRYLPNSTTTVLGFDGPNMSLNITNLTANTESIINPLTNRAALNFFVDRNTQGGTLGINSNSGLSRILARIDSNQQGQINFFKDDAGASGTQLNVSSVASKYLVGSTLELATGLILHPANDLTLSSFLNTDINGNLYWNGSQINREPGPPNSSFYSSFNSIYTSTLQTTNVILRGENSLSTAILYADSSLTLYWNNQPIQSNKFTSSILEYAQINKVSTLKITTSSIQGVYDRPSLQAKWIVTGINNGSPSPLYYSLSEQTSYSQSNATFFNSGNSVYGNIYTGQIIAVGSDINNTYNTIKLSTDGVNWQNIYVNNPFINSANVVYFANNLWLIGGYTIAGPPIIWSSDGYNFNRPSVYPTDASMNAHAFNYNGEIYVAGLDKGYDYTTSILWSTDGKSWNRIVSGGFNSTTAVASNKNFWVACGQTPLPGALSRIQWSTDAVNWYPSLSCPSAFTTGNSINYANGIWVIGGSGSNSLGTLLWSTDGKNWNSQSSGNISTVYDVKYINDIWYASGSIDSNNGILISVDGKNWSYNIKLYPYPFYQLAVKSIYYLETVLLGNGSINFSPSTSLYVTATISSYEVTTTNITGQISNISSITTNQLISPNTVQIQNVTF